MRQLIIGNTESGGKELLIRKSKWIFYFLISKLIFLFVFLFYGGFGIYLLFFVGGFGYNVSSYSYHFKGLVGMIILLLITYFFILSIMLVIRYFYDIVICSSDKITKVKLGLFGNDMIDSIELSRVQEMEVNMKGFLKRNFNIGDISFIEINGMKKNISGIDNPQRVMLLIKELKDSIIKDKFIKTFKVDK